MNTNGKQRLLFHEEQGCRGTLDLLLITVEVLQLNHI